MHNKKIVRNRANGHLRQMFFNTKQTDLFKKKSF